VGREKGESTWEEKKTKICRQRKKGEGRILGRGPGSDVMGRTKSETLDREIIAGGRSQKSKKKKKEKSAWGNRPPQGGKLRETLFARVREGGVESGF